MHQSTPYGLHEIGLPLTDEDKAFVSNVAARISNLKDLSGVDSLKMVYDLPDGGYVIVQNTGGNFRVISHKPIDFTPEVITDGIETDDIPMFFSGVIIKDTVFEGEPVEIRLTEQARLRLAGYDASAPMPSKEIGLQRFRIDYGDAFQEFSSDSEHVLRTQYVQQRPTWYTGAMAEVMQIVGGYGRQDFVNLPDEDINPYERARIAIPGEWLDRINVELTGLRLPAYTGLPPTDGTFQFDYKFNKTNAISFDDDNKPWLLQIASNGVWAMPLPIIPATKTAAFRQYMESVDDQEVIAILDKFGAMPSGETLPASAYLEDWRRAGAVIKVCDSSDFYNHISYSSACGWSLNSKGSEGYNTCYDYYDDEGLGYGLTYKLSLSMSSTDEYYGAEGVEITKDTPYADEMREYLTQLIPTIGTESNSGRAILFKLRRADPNLIYERSLSSDGSDDINYWDNLELDPIAVHTGNISEVYRGYLYNGASFEYQPQIKFPEPLVGGCLSHDFLPLLNGRYKSSYPNSNTIMFAYYLGNNLKVVKYFIDYDSFERSIEGNFETYMTVGAWSQTVYTGSTSPQGNFYSSDIDDRELVSGSTTQTSIKGEDKGYDSKPRFSFDAPFSMWGTMFRYRFYTHETKTTVDTGKSISVAVCVPYFCRDALLSVKKESVISRSITDSLALYSVRDPYTYRYWTYHPVFAWASSGGQGTSPTNGSPSPVNGNPVWVEEMRYSPTAANNFADSGDWVVGLPADYTWLIHPDSNVWNQSGGGGGPNITGYNVKQPAVSETTGTIRLSIDGQPYLVNKNIPSTRYFIGSPTELGDIFYRDACAIKFGSFEYQNVQEPNDKQARASWGYTQLADHTKAHHFIGVINE